MGTVFNIPVGNNANIVRKIPMDLKYIYFYVHYHDCVLCINISVYQVVTSNRIIFTVSVIFVRPVNGGGGRKFK